MATIYNSDLSKELINGARIQVNRDRVPNELADKVVPVMEVNPKLLRRSKILGSGIRVVSGGLTIFTTDNQRDTYITGVAIDYSKDIACDVPTGTICSVTVTIDGATTNLLKLSGITLKSENSSLSICLNAPLKIDKNTGVLITAVNYAAGLMCRNATIYGYLDEISNS